MNTVEEFNFSKALAKIKHGMVVSRKGWNGKNMFIFLVPGSTFITNRAPLIDVLGKDVKVVYNSHIDMKTADGSIVPWLASQSDLLAEDWMEVSLK